ncbi:MAG TPA: hypothetical protein VKJ65_04655 [Phycisphaerae bacterium]|nr:hypothetical protein [Phycisphaerae bacterium]
MKFEAGKTYKTRGGEEAFIYCVDAPGALPIHGRIGAALYSWTEGGNILSVCSHQDDLIAPEPERISRMVWVNIHKNNDSYYYFSQDEARSCSGHPGSKRIAVPCLITEIVSPE